LDNIVQLKKSSDEQEGALRFDVKTIKCRHHERPKDFGAKMVMINGTPTWDVIDIDWTNMERAAELFKDGMTAPEVAVELGISRSQGYRLKADTK